RTLSFAERLHHHVPRAFRSQFRSLMSFRGGLEILQRSSIENGLLEVRTHVLITEGPDHQSETRKVEPERRQIDLLRCLGCANGEIRQQSAESPPPFRPDGIDNVAVGKNPEIV